MIDEYLSITCESISISVLIFERPCWPCCVLRLQELPWLRPEPDVPGPQGPSAATQGPSHPQWHRPQLQTPRRHQRLPEACLHVRKCPGGRSCLSLPPPTTVYRDRVVLATHVTISSVSLFSLCVCCCLFMHAFVLRCMHLYVFIHECLCVCMCWPVALSRAPLRESAIFSSAFDVFTRGR